MASEQKKDIPNVPAELSTKNLYDKFKGAPRTLSEGERAPLRAQAEEKFGQFLQDHPDAMDKIPEGKSFEDMQAEFVGRELKKLERGSVAVDVTAQLREMRTEMRKKMLTEVKTELQEQQKRFAEMQAEADGIILSESGLSPEEYRKYYAEFLQKNNLEEAQAMTVEVNGEKKNFVEMTSRVTSKVGESLKKGWESAGDAWDVFAETGFAKWFENAGKELADTSVASYNQTMRPFHPGEGNFSEKGKQGTANLWDNIQKGAPLGVPVWYLNYYWRDVNPTTIQHKGGAWNPVNHMTPRMWEAGTFAAIAGILPVVMAPVMKGLELLVEGAGEVGFWGTTVVKNGLMTFARGEFTNTFAGGNLEYLTTGKTRFTQSKEALIRDFDHADKSRELVPNGMDWYKKMLDGKDTLTDEEVAEAAQFCVKSLDENMLMSSEEFKNLRHQIVDQGRWRSDMVPALRRLMVNAYAGRIFLHFSTVATDAQFEKFATKFSETFVQREEQRAKDPSKVDPKLAFSPDEMNKMFDKKIDEKIAYEQSYGIRSFMEEGGLQDILVGVAMTVLAVKGAYHGSKLLQKMFKEKEKHAENFLEEKLERKEAEEIKKAFEVDPKKAKLKDVKTALDLLVKHKILSSKTAELAKGKMTEGTRKNSGLGGLRVNTFFDTFRTEGSFLAQVESLSKAKLSKQFWVNFGSVDKFAFTDKERQLLAMEELSHQYRILERNLDAKHGLKNARFTLKGTPDAPVQFTEMKQKSTGHLVEKGELKFSAIYKENDAAEKKKITVKVSQKADGFFIHFKGKSSAITGISMG